jgi:hypothetical protein
MKDKIVRIIEDMIMENNADFIPIEDVENCANQIIDLIIKTTYLVVFFYDIGLYPG